MDKNIVTEPFIVINRGKCNKCKQIIQSKNRHDFVMCKCNSVGVDGGLEYLKRTGNPEDFTELSLYSNDNFGIIRQSFKWGSFYTKNNKLRKAIKWISLYMMEDSHIKAILDGNFTEKFRFLFEEELKFRKNEINK